MATARSAAVRSWRPPAAGRNETIPPPSRICVPTSPASRACGPAAQARVGHPRDVRPVGQEPRRSPRRWRCSARPAGGASAARAGPGSSRAARAPPPIAFWRKRSRSATASSEVTAMPERSCPNGRPGTWSRCGRRCRRPESSGRWIAGEANVLSTTTSGRRPPAAARSRTAADGGGDVDQLEQRIGRGSRTRPAGSVRPSASQSASVPEARSTYRAIRPPAAGGPARGSGTCRRRRRRRRRSRRPARPGRRSPRSPPSPTRRRSRGCRPRAPRPPAPAARGSGSATASTRSPPRAGRRRPGRRSRSGRSAARPRRSARPARPRRGRPACRRSRRFERRRDRASRHHGTGAVRAWAPSHRARRPAPRRRCRRSGRRSGGSRSRRTIASEATLPGETDGAEPADAVLAGGPVEHGPHDLGGDTLAAVAGLDAIAHLDPTIGVRRRMEPDRTDDPARRRRARSARSPDRATAAPPDPRRDRRSGTGGSCRAGRPGRRGRSRRSRPPRPARPGPAAGA